MKRHNDGFALVEVCLALGILSFAIVAMLGLLAVGINSNKSSLENTVLSVMSRQVIGTLREQQFSDLPNIAGVTTAAPATLQVIYFDVNGTRLQDTSASPPTDLGKTAALGRGALYQCAVTAQGDVQTTGLSLSTQPVLLNLSLTFTWPVQATTPPNNVVIHSSLARYD